MGKKQLEKMLTIKDLPLESRPRERLIHNGSEQLSSAELIAIILRVGSSKRTALGVAEDLLSIFGDIHLLAQAPIEEILNCYGVGVTKAVQLKAAFELGRRLLTISPVNLPVIKSPADIFNLLNLNFQDLDREYFKVVHLNTKNQVIKIETTAIGILNSTPVHPREVFKTAIRISSASIILTHNHPSGDPSPSKDDIVLTDRLCESGKILGIAVLDHLIFGKGCYLSLKEAGYLN